MHIMRIYEHRIVCEKLAKIPKIAIIKNPYLAA